MPISAAVVAAGVGAVGSIASAAMQSGSTGSAASSANKISQEAVAEATKDYAPYTQAGTQGVTTYADLLGVNGPDAASAAMGKFVSSPGYGYQVQQGLKAVDAGAAANGLLRSGATLKAEQTLGSNLANQDFGNYLGRLNTLATNGLSATGNLTNIMSGQATQQQQTAVSQGANDASIYGNAAKGVTGALGTAYQNGAFNNLFSSSTGSDGFRAGVGGANSTGANTLQSLGFYAPLV